MYLRGSLAPKPAALSFEQAAAVPLAASTALQGLRDHGRVEPGHKVLIIGPPEAWGPSPCRSQSPSMPR